MSFGRSVGKKNKAANVFAAPLHLAIEPGLSRLSAQAARAGCAARCDRRLPGTTARCGPSYVAQL